MVTKSENAEEWLCCIFKIAHCRDAKHYLKIILFCILMTRLKRLDFRQALIRFWSVWRVLISDSPRKSNPKGVNSKLQPTENFSVSSSRPSCIDISAETGILLCNQTHFLQFFMTSLETNLFLLSHRQVLVLKIGGTALMGVFLWDWWRENLCFWKKIVKIEENSGKLFARVK